MNHHAWKFVLVMLAGAVVACTSRPALTPAPTPVAVPGPLPTNTPTLEPTAEWPTPFSLGEAGTSFGASGELTQRYESDSYPFALQVPVDWVSSEQDKALATSFCQGAEICYGSILGD
ncbi:MAG: hypothetical protein ACK2UH_02345, partial [Candidatus Promineifilaceae bacterium]